MRRHMTRRHHLSGKTGLHRPNKWDNAGLSAELAGQRAGWEASRRRLPTLFDVSSSASGAAPARACSRLYAPAAKFRYIAEMEVIARDS